MICESWPALLESARKGREPRGELLAHLESCPHCEQRFERERTLTAQFSALRQTTTGGRSGNDRHGKLLREFQALERPHRRRRWAIGIAAMLLASVALIGTWQVQSRPDLAETFADADEYTAVPYAVPLASGEFVRVLHAELPTSSLIQMGLDLDGETDVTPVDLIVGEDDQPRAVRISSDDF